MPSLGPILWNARSEHWYARNADARLTEHGLIDELRTPAPKARSHNNYRLDMLSCQKLTNLISRIERNRFACPYGNDFEMLQSRHLSHYIDDVFRHEIRFLGIRRSVSGNQKSRAQPSALKCSGSLEKQVIHIVVVHKDSIGGASSFIADQASSDSRNPEAPSHRHDKSETGEQPQP